MIEALKKEVINQDGIAIDDVKIMELIDELKQSKHNSPEKFLKSLIWFLINYIDLYVQEIRTQIRFAGLCFEQYIVAKEKGDIERIFWHVHHFAVHAANIDKLLDKLFSPPESLTANFFRENIDLNDVDMKQFRPMRNHLEHFEERLDVWAYLHIGKPVFDMNLINNQTKGIVKENYLRLLMCDRDEFIILGERFNLRKLHEQICLLDAKICQSQYWAG